MIAKMLEAGAGIEHNLSDQSGPRSPLKSGAKVNSYDQNGAEAPLRSPAHGFAT
jgi:hypothetical protein